MSPITSTLANGSAYGYRTFAAAAAGAYESIATNTLSGTAASVTFSGIPSTYASLQVRILARDASTGSATNNLKYQFNSDTGSNYVGWHYLEGDGTSANAGAYATLTYSALLRAIPGSNASNTLTYGAVIMDIHDYASTSKYKTVRSIGGHDRNGTGYIELGSSLYMSTTAISSITFNADSGNYAAGTTFALYGIKGA